jgi:hypothetical protein
LREARHASQPRGELAFLAVVPAEVHVRVGAAVSDVGQHAGVRDHRTRAVGALQAAFDRRIEHGLVPGRQLLADDEGADRLGP